MIDMIECLFKAWLMVFGVCAGLFVLYKLFVPETSWSILTYIAVGTLIVPVVLWGLGKIIHIQ